MNSDIKKLSVRHKNNKVSYYSLNFIRQILPRSLYRNKLEEKLESFRKYDYDYIKTRLNYYNKLSEYIPLSENVERLEDFTLKKKNKTYFFDTYQYSRYFPGILRFNYEFGDVTEIPLIPSIVKSRPINGNNVNSVMLNLDKVRHFTFVTDRTDFSKKKNMLVSRNAVSQPHRIKFMEKYINHPLCNVGKINNDGTYPHLLKERMTIDEQLKYKFIVCIEGNDVASNLKWVMSSNSLAVMPHPKYETWFMEGTLIPDYHYMLIKDDYSDLEERMEYFMSHTDEAEEITQNANRYIEQYRDKEREELLSLLVLEKYFYRTNQFEASDALIELFTK